MTRLRVLTWNVHGNYLYYLSHAPHDFYLPVGDPAIPGYGGRGESFPFGRNVRDIPAALVPEMEFDCILYQSERNYLVDRFELLTDQQRRLPQVYVEHNPPRESPTDTCHPVDDPSVLVVHVTPFNQLMWDNGDVPTRVVEHGVVVPPGVSYRGELDRGIVVVNDLCSRGRRLGADIFEEARASVPLDLVGMRTDACGGLGEVPPMELLSFESRYRFFFHPVRYTSLGLAVCEAMMIGMPVVGLATTELPTVITNGETGYIDTRVDRLVSAMQELLAEPREAMWIGQAARRRAMERFNIDRFVTDWHRVLCEATGAPRGYVKAVATGGGS